MNVWIPVGGTVRAGARGRPLPVGVSVSGRAGTRPCPCLPWAQSVALVPSFRQKKVLCSPTSGNPWL